MTGQWQRAPVVEPLHNSYDGEIITIHVAGERTKHRPPAVHDGREAVRSDAGHGLADNWAMKAYHHRKAEPALANCHLPAVAAQPFLCCKADDRRRQMPMQIIVGLCARRWCRIPRAPLLCFCWLPPHDGFCRFGLTLFVL